MTSDPLTRFLSQRTSWAGRRLRLRAMMPKEVLDYSLQAYQALGKQILGATILTAFLQTAALAFTFNFAIPNIFKTTHSKSDLIGQILDSTLAIGLIFLVAVPLVLISGSYMVGLVGQLTSDWMNGNVPTRESAVRAANRSFLALLKLTFREVWLCSFTVLVGFALLVVSALYDRYNQQGILQVFTVILATLAVPASLIVTIYILSNHILAWPIILNEGGSAKAAGKRSQKLLSSIPSAFGPVRSVYYVSLFLIFVLFSGFSAVDNLINVSDVIKDLTAGTIASDVMTAAWQVMPIFLAVWFVAPGWAIFATILYYERRIRLEGYDIEAMAQDVWRLDQHRRFQL